MQHAKAMPKYDDLDENVSLVHDGQASYEDSPIKLPRDDSPLGSCIHAEGDWSWLSIAPRSSCMRCLLSRRVCGGANPGGARR